MEKKPLQLENTCKENNNNNNSNKWGKKKTTTNYVSRTEWWRGAVKRRTLKHTHTHAYNRREGHSEEEGGGAEMLLAVKL